MGYCTGVMHMALKEAGGHGLLHVKCFSSVIEFQQLLGKNYYKCRIFIMIRMISSLIFAIVDKNLYEILCRRLFPMKPLGG